MENKIDIITETPWKVFNELKMYFLKPLCSLYLKSKKINIGKNFKFYGLPKVLKHKGSSIVIGKRFENRNWWYSNPLGINHPTIICTWSKEARIVIGKDVGISGGSVVASKEVKIGDGTLIGANTIIIDTDFHPIKSKKRRYDTENIKSASINIGKNVFIGTGSTILKGSSIPNDTIVPAGTVVRFNTKF